MKGVVMKFRRTYLMGSGLVWACFLLFPVYSYAYLDPGTGSYFLQMLIGIFIGIAFAVKIYWAKIKSFFTKGKK